MPSLVSLSVSGESELKVHYRPPGSLVCTSLVTGSLSLYGSKLSFQRKGVNDTENSPCMFVE